MTENWITITEASRRAQRPRRTMLWWLKRLNRLEGGRLLQRANEGGRKWLVSVVVLEELLSKKRAERKGMDLRAEIERLSGSDTEVRERLDGIEERLDAHRVKLREHDGEFVQVKRALSGLKKSSEGLHEVAAALVGP